MSVHRTGSSRWLFAGCCAALFSLLIVGTSGADLLHAEVASVAMLPRAAAPMWVEVKLNSKSTRLREGSLEFTHRVLGQPQWVYITNELALSGGPQTYRFLLPPPQTRLNEDRSLRVRFLDKGGGSSDLGIFPLTTQARPGTPLTLAVGPASARMVGDLRPMWLNFRLERFDAQNAGGGQLFSTGAAVLEPGDFPTDAVGYTAFDAVLLEGADFARLKEKALEALGQWLAAGGGLLVTTDAAFDAAHAEALQNWTASDSRALPAKFGPEGKRAEGGDEFSFARVGYGRLVVAPARPAEEKEYDSEQWRQATAWFWKVRRQHTESIVETGAFRDRPSRDGLWYATEHRITQALESLTHSLLPKTVRVMPRNVVFGLLAAFVLLIGPIDWWLLGRLRARRFTWLLFPVVTAGVTVAMMKLARHYLGEGNHRGALVVTDLAPDGRVVRETRLDLLLPARRGTLSIDLQKALCLPAQMRRENESAEGGLTFSGSFPQRYSLTRPVEQWSPVITRQTRVGPGEDLSRMKWDEFRLAFLEQRRMPELAQALAGESGCSVCFAHESGLSPGDSGVVEQGLLDVLTFIAPTGRTGAFSHISPSGSATLEDLPCIESGDDRSTLVIASRRDGLDLHIWRRLYLH